MCTIEQGTCDICGKTNVPLSRYYQYWNVKCDCCSPQHFDLTRHCKDCKPVELLTTQYANKGREYQFFPILNVHFKLPK